MYNSARTRRCAIGSRLQKMVLGSTSLLGPPKLAGRLLSVETEGGMDGGSKKEEGICWKQLTSGEGGATAALINVGRSLFGV